MPNKRSTFLPWLKWGALITIIIIGAALIYGVVMINDIKKQREAGFSQSKATVLDETDITEIDHIDPFYESVSYHIVFGTTESGEGKIVFLPLEENTSMTVLDQDKAVPKKIIREKWKQSCSGCTLISIQAAMIDQNPLWELTYNDEGDRHVLDYISMEDSKRYEQWTFKNHYK